MSRCVDSSSISKLTFWWVDNLISTLINKLATAVLRAGGQYSYNIRGTDLKAESLIQVLSLQMITWSKIRLTADDLVSYRKTLNSLSQRTVFLSIFISESISYSSLNFSKKNTIILNLIKDTQEFNSQCRWISSQLHRKLKENLSFVLHENEILKKMNHVFVFQQKIIWVQLLELYHDCSNNDN